MKKTLGLVCASYSLPKWQAIKLAFFASWFIIIFKAMAILDEDAIHQLRFLGNCPPTPPLTQNFAPSEMQMLSLSSGRGMWAVSQRTIIVELGVPWPLACHYKGPYSSPTHFFVAQQLRNGLVIQRPWVQVLLRSLAGFVLGSSEFKSLAMLVT